MTDTPASNTQPNSHSTPIVSKPASGIRWRIFILMLVIVTINYVDRSAISVALPLIRHDIHFGAVATGFILSAFFWSYAGMQIPGGWLADHVGPRKVISASAAGWGIAQALTGLATSVPIFYFLRLLLGFFEGPVYPAGGKLNATWMPAHDRSRGATLLDGGAPLGSAVGAIIISGLILVFDIGVYRSSSWASRPSASRSSLIGTSVIILRSIALWLSPKSNTSERSMRSRTNGPTYSVTLLIELDHSTSTCGFLASGGCA